MEPVHVVAIAVAAALFAAALAAVVVVVAMRRQGSGRGADADRVAVLERELAALRDGKADAERRLAAEERTAGRVPSLEREIEERTAQAEVLREAKAASEVEAARTREAASRSEDMLAASRARVVELEEMVRRTADRMEALRSERAKAEEVLATSAANLASAETRLSEAKGRLEEAARRQTDLAARLESALREKGEAEARLAESTAIQGGAVEELARLRAEALAERARHEEARKAAAVVEADLAAVRERLEQETARSAEKLALLGEARERMSAQFKELADGLLARHGETFAKQNREQVEGLLNPLREKIVEFEQGVRLAHTETAKECAALSEQIRGLSESSARMTSETHNLTRALKGKAQTQGAWGEMILATILERSGLRSGEEYVTQESHTDDEGARFRPDVIVNLPGGQRVVIDAKVSLTAFEEHVGATDETVGEDALARHVASMRSHVRTLSGKEYQSVVGGVLDYVIMFVPIEGALAVALQRHPELTVEAAAANVAIATPTTLMMALRTIANVWSVERRNSNAEAIAERAGRLYDKFLGFVDDMQALGSQLDRAKGSFDDAMGKLSSGKGNLVRQVETLRGLGAKTAKALPARLLDDAGPESVAAIAAAE